MKRLQETGETRWEFKSSALLDGMIRRVEDPKQIILLLHGFNERGRRIYRKLIGALPADATVIAPNGPFPIPRMKENEIQYGFTWYFYDRFKKDYFITMEFPISWLQELLKLENPKNLPVTIIGFSQGGYLAPSLGLSLKETKMVIGIGCEFRSVLLKTKPSFPLIAIHGDADETVKKEWAQEQIHLLAERGINVDLHIVAGAKHEITAAVADLVQKTLE